MLRQLLVPQPSILRALALALSTLFIDKASRGQTFVKRPMAEVRNVKTHLVFGLAPNFSPFFVFSASPQAHKVI